MPVPHPEPNAAAKGTGMPRAASLISREVLPFAAWLLALALAALLVDAVLHYFDQVWVGRWLGIPGVALILASLHYSLRKRKIVTRGNPVTLLRRHEVMAWAGSLLVLVHAGMDFGAEYAGMMLAEAEKTRDAAAIAKAKAEAAQFARDYAQPWWRMGVTATEILPVGLLVSLMAAGWLSRRHAAVA
jgi:hypothetical protein